MALFKLGAIVATPGALQFCEEHSIDPLALIGRHVGGDFGDLDAGDVAANVHGIKHDLRVFSSYVCTATGCTIVSSLLAPISWNLFPTLRTSTKPKPSAVSGMVALRAMVVGAFTAQ